MKTALELSKYLRQLAMRADYVREQGWPEPENVQALCAQIWKEFTPDAVTHLSPGGVLMHLADCLEPPPPVIPDEDDE